MGTAATIYRFQIELSDIDRSVYETLELRVARHASEDAERLVVRALARAIVHEDGLVFGRGLSNPEDAALWTHSATGEIDTWIDVGQPTADRLHRASKAARRLLVFTHKPGAALRKEWRTRKIHRADEVLVHQLPPKLVAALAESLERRVSWYVTLQDRMLGVTVGEQSLEGLVEVVSLASICRAE